MGWRIPENGAEMVPASESRKAGDKVHDNPLVASTDRKWDRRWRPGKFHFGQNIFVLNWALASASERKKCKKLQFPSQKSESRKLKSEIKIGVLKA